MIDLYGFRADFAPEALAVQLGQFALYRTLQVLALKFLNNPDK